MKLLLEQENENSKLVKWNSVTAPRLGGSEQPLSESGSF